MEQRGKWNFPAFSFPYEKKGLNDSGIETFNDNVLRSLAREICQNSLDAKADNSSVIPVTVEFSRFTQASSDFPGIDDFREMFKSAPDKKKNNKNKGAVILSTPSNTFS